MKLFGFEISGPSSLSVVCPKCGDLNANITFIPSKENTPISFPPSIQGDLQEVIEELKLSDYLSLPRYDDLHFFCMKCATTLRYCEQLKKKCLLGKRI